MPQLTFIPSLPPSMTSCGLHIEDLSFVGWFESIPARVYRSDLTADGSIPCSFSRVTRTYHVSLGSGPAMIAGLGKAR